MPSDTPTLRLRCIDSLTRISAPAWDICSQGDGTGNPFVRHAFLSALEQSGSASPESGWGPTHLLAEDETGTLLGCVPLYLKSHSYGEYVFDWSWAEAWEKAGGHYYPKLQCAVPFTPATGPRLLLRPDLPNPDSVAVSLLGGMITLAKRLKLSSAHITFPTASQCTQAEAQGWMPRLGEQFHWNNPGYGSFDDFLGALSSRKRKAIRKERDRAQSLGLTFHCLTGADLNAAHWDAFYDFYLGTVEKKWAHAYLTRDFFDLLGQTMADQVVLMMAAQDGQWVAGALNLLGQDCLFGRNWGAAGDFPFLHFELCYYRAMDFAIERGLSRIEAGAQGEHKVARGYLPTATWSAHWINDPGFSRAVATFLGRERTAVQQTMTALSEESPYRKQNEGGP